MWPAASAGKIRRLGDKDEENTMLFKTPTSQVLGYAMAALLDCAVDLLWLPVDVLREAQRRERQAEAAAQAASKE